MPQSVERIKGGETSMVFVVFPKAPVTNYNRLGGSDSSSVLSHSSGG